MDSLISKTKTPTPTKTPKSLTPLKAPKPPKPPKPPTLKELFAHEESLVRPCLQHLRQTQPDAATALVVQELELSRGLVRADIALLADCLHGFEIKAGKDTLTRLPLQIATYDEVFAYNWLITTPNHLKKAQTLLPAWWGILVPEFEIKEGLCADSERSPAALSGLQAANAVLEGATQPPAVKDALMVLKPAQVNPMQEPLGLAKLLWREELLSALKRLDRQKGNATLNKRKLCSKLIDAMTLAELNELVLSCLRSRMSWRAYPLVGC